MAQKKYGYRYMDDVTVADAAFEVFAGNKNDLFSLAAEAMFGIMIDLAKVSSDERHVFKLESDSLEELLYLFLSELIYLKDVEKTLFSKFDVEISERFTMTARVYGQKMEKLKVSPKIDIKAVTYYRFKVERLDDSYHAVVVIDL